MTFKMEAGADVSVIPEAECGKDVLHTLQPTQARLKGQTFVESSVQFCVMQAGPQAKVFSMFSAVYAADSSEDRLLKP